MLTYYISVIGVHRDNGCPAVISSREAYGRQWVEDLAYGRQWVEDHAAKVDSLTTESSVVIHTNKRHQPAHRIDVVDHGFNFVDLGLVRSSDGDIPCTREACQSRAELKRPRPRRLRVDGWTIESVLYGNATTLPRVYYRFDYQRPCRS